MVANRRTLTVVSWALVVLVVISAVVTLILSLDLLLPNRPSSRTTSIS